MKKSFLKLSAFLVFSIGLSTAVFTSCSSDDTAVYNIATDGGVFEAETFSELTIDPKINVANATYTWFNHTDNISISAQPILKYTFNEPGEYKLSLKVEQTNGKIDIVTYSVKVTKSVDYSYVTSSFKNFDLTDGITTAGGKIWSETFTEDVNLENGIFTFKHIAFPDWDTWMGFTVSNSKDNENHLLTD